MAELADIYPPGHWRMTVAVDKYEPICVDVDDTGDAGANCPQSTDLGEHHLLECESVNNLCKANRVWRYPMHAGYAFCLGLISNS